MKLLGEGPGLAPLGHSHGAAGRPSLAVGAEVRVRGGGPGVVPRGARDGGGSGGGGVRQPAVSCYRSLSPRASGGVVLRAVGGVGGGGDGSQGYGVLPSSL